MSRAGDGQVFSLAHGGHLYCFLLTASLLHYENHHRRTQNLVRGVENSRPNTPEKCCSVPQPEGESLWVAAQSCGPNTPSVCHLCLISSSSTPQPSTTADRRPPCSLVWTFPLEQHVRDAPESGERASEPSWCWTWSRTCYGTGVMNRCCNRSLCSEGLSKARRVLV